MDKLPFKSREGRKGHLLDQQFTDVLKLAHVGELLLHQLLDAAAHAHRDDLQAAAGCQHHEMISVTLKSAKINRFNSGSGYEVGAHQCVYFEQHH